ncbi:MAG TPA: aspartate/glutamate racemase family protein [Candidatus Bathyarchaeia archaeon]|nr:aspartate/glutamate racemase family protein [Candidatus Bathyarchaeia archaeon]
MGLIGGMSWESSQEYYRIINEETQKQLHGLHSAQCLMFSFDFAEIEQLQRQAHWDAATQRMVKAAQNLERGGADFLLICSNTMHKMANDIQSSVSIPILHIVDPTAMAIKRRGITRVGLLGTKFTMEEDFYKNRLARFELEALIPDNAQERHTLNEIIFGELCLGAVLPESKKKCLEIIRRLEERGAQGIILGCTELGLLVQQSDTSLPVFDTTRIHAEAAVSMALQ